MEKENLDSNELEIVDQNENIVLNNSVLITVPPLEWEEEDILATQEIYKSWNLSASVRALLKAYGVNTVEVLEKIEIGDIDKLFDNWDIGYFGDRIKFKSCVKQWRKERNKSLLCDQECLSPSDARKVMEWLENISKKVCSSSKDYSEIGSVSLPSFVPHGGDVRRLLQTTITGQLVLTYYEKNCHLDSKRQKDLTHCIVDSFVGKQRMTYRDMTNWSNAIVEIFPTESAETYFLPRKPGKKNPTGKLFSRWCNVDHTAHTPNDSNLNGITDDVQPVENSDDICEKKSWLQNNCSPWDTVKQYWKDSSSYRTKQFQSTSNTCLVELLKEWPRFNDAHGYELIDIDFETLFPGKGNQIFIKYDQFFQRCLLLFKEEVKDKVSKDLLKFLHQKEISTDSKSCITTLLLHCVLQPVRCNKGYKPTILDAQNDFVVHIKSINNLQLKLEELIKEFAERNETLQPRIVVVGPEIQNIKEFYVFCNGIKYKCCTFNKCLDVIIKLCYVYNISYSPRSKLVWAFLENYFFELKSEKFSSVVNLLNKLKSN